MKFHWLTAVLALQFAGAATLHAGDAATALAAAATAMGAPGLNAIQYSATGSVYPAGQAYKTGGAGPRYSVSQYTMTINYGAAAMRQELVRIDDQRPPRGGGAGAFNPLTGQGGIRPIPGPIRQMQASDGRSESGALALWLTPHGFLKGAAENAATASMSRVRGKNVISFIAFGKYTVSATLSARNLVERVATRMDAGFTGDTLFENIYSNYRDIGGIKFPMTIVYQQGGLPALALKITKVQPNAPSALEMNAVSAPVAQTSPYGRIEAEKIAAGVWLLTPGGYGSLLVEFDDYLVVIEAPGDDAQTMATIAEANRLVPDKPIKYVINTHHHADHAGGLRAFVAEDITVITHQSHKRYYEREIFKNPHTFNPDRLARTPRAPRIETVNARRILSDGKLRDGKMALEMHLLRGNLHSEGLLMIYIPGAKLVVQADAYHPRPGVPPLAAPSPFTANLVDNIERLKLDVAQVAHIHGGITPYADILEAAGR